MNIIKLTLNVRENAIEFNKVFNFNQIGEKYRSTKTGVIHQKISKELE